MGLKPLDGQNRVGAFLKYEETDARKIRRENSLFVDEDSLNARAETAHEFMDDRVTLGCKAFRL